MNTVTKPEIWDKLQFLLSKFYDRMMHTVFYFDKEVDSVLLGKVLYKMVEQVPILHSRFVNSPVNPRWVEQPFVLEDFYYVIQTNDVEETLNRFLTQYIDYRSNVQLRYAVINCDGKSVLCQVSNHMLFDGGDLKYFTHKLRDNYNASLASGELVCDIKTGSRSHKQVYAKFNEEERKVAEKLYKNVSVVKEKYRFPFTEKSSADKCRVVKRKLSKEMFSAFKAKGKQDGATINDLMLTAYMRSLYKVLGISKDDRLTIPSMIDLRRHMEGGATEGLSNHTGFMVCSIPRMGETFKDTLELVCNAMTPIKADKYIGLYSIPLLELAYKVLPYFIAQTAIKIGYYNPLMGMSNIGVLDGENLSYGDAKVVDGFFTGAIKFKPYMQLAMTTLYGEVTFTIAVRCNDEDEKIINSFFDILCGEIETYINN